MKFLFFSFFSILLITPFVSYAQYTDQFIIQTEINGTTTPTAGGGSSGSGTRVERSDQASNTTYVPNVRDIKIVSDGEKIRLTWKNPAVAFSAIRVVQSDFYAKDPYDGWVVYEGSGQSFFSPSPGERGSFYTFFVVMGDGRHSSGIGTFYAETPAVEPVEKPVFPPPLVPIDKPEEPTPVEPEEVVIDDNVWQKVSLVGSQTETGKVTLLQDAMNPFSATEDIEFSIAINSLPAQVQSVVLLFKNLITGESEQFLLQRDGAVLTAVVPRRLVAGVYTFSVGLYDYSTTLQTSTTYAIDVYPHYFVSETAAPTATATFYDYIYVLYIITGLLAVLLVWRVVVVVRRRK